MPTSEPTRQHDGKSRRARFRFIGLYLSITIVLLLGTGLTITYRYFTHPDRINRLADELIEKLTGGEVVINAADFSFSKMQVNIQLHQLRLDVSSELADEQKLFHAVQVNISMSPWSLITGQAQADSLELVKPTLYITENLDTKTFNYEKVAFSTFNQSDDFKQVLPEIVINEGYVRFGEIQSDQYKPLGDMLFYGRLVENTRQAGIYNFAMGQVYESSQTPQGSSLTGSFNTRKMTVKLRLDHFNFDQPQRTLLPQQLRDWWDRLEPEGTLPTVNVNFQLDKNNRFKLESARLVIDNASLTLPYSEYHTRMSQVQGEFIIKGDTIILKNLQGLVENIQYALNGTIEGFDTDSPFSLAATTQPFIIPEKPEYLYALPEHIKRVHERLNPYGELDVDAKIARLEKGGPITCNGTVNLIDIQARYHKFPYPLKHINGQILFSQEKVDVVDLKGLGPTGGQIIINGTVQPPRDGAQVDMILSCSNIPIDRHLTEAMKPNHQKIMNMFFDQEAHAKLIENGLIRAGDNQAEPDELDNTPTFQLGGVLQTVDVTIHRPPGKDVKYDVTSSFPVSNINAIFKYWPYPFTSTSGHITISRKLVNVDNLTLKGPTGTSIGRIHGIIQRPDAQKLLPQLVVEDVYLPVDRFLLQSIPPPKDEWLRNLNLTGAITADGNIYQNDLGKIDYTMAAKIEQAVITPWSGQFTLNEINGDLVLRRSIITLERVVGRRNSSTVTVSGTASWDQPLPEFNLHVTADQFNYDRAVIDLIPPEHPVRERLDDLWLTYKPEGSFQAELDISGKADLKNVDYHLTILPNDIAFDFRNQRFQFNDLAGKVTVRPNHLELEDLDVRFGYGSIHLSGLVNLEGEGGIAVGFTAQSDRLDSITRAALPTTAVRVIDELQIDGGYSVNDARLMVKPLQADSYDLEFDCQVLLDNTTAKIGVPVSDLTGSLTINVNKQRNQNMPRIDLTLNAEKLNVAGRLIQPLTMSLTTKDRLDILRLQELRGTIYNGILVGSGAVLLGSPSLYRFDLTMHDVEVDPFLHPEKFTGEPPQAELDAAQPNDSIATDNSPDKPKPLIRTLESGLLSASLSIEADYNQSNSRRGRGTLLVRDASLYKQPISLAILHAINLSLPTAGSFDRASARYLLDGDEILFDFIRFEAPSLTVAGSGSMDFPTRELDLRMHTRNPAALELGPISDIINVFKDEVITIKVTGPLEKPHSRGASFTGLSKTWSDLFGETSANADKTKEVKAKKQNHK